MNLEEIRELARKGIEAPVRESKFAYRPEVQRLWGDLERTANRFQGLPLTTRTAQGLQAALQLVLENGIAEGVLPCTQDEVDGLRVEVDESMMEVVWPPTVRKFFEEERKERKP